MPAPTWELAAAEFTRSRPRRFLAQRGFRSVDKLRQYAANDPAWDWNTGLRVLDIRWLRPPSQILDCSHALPWATLLPDAVSHYVADVLGRWETASRPALVWEGDDGRTRELTCRDNATAVPRIATGLAALGVGPEDRVGLFLLMISETALATLALGRLGAIIVPVSSGFGPAAVATRLRNAEAAVVITADALPRRGQLVPLKEIADRAVAECPTIQHVVIVRRGGTPVSWTATRDRWWDDLVDSPSGSLPATASPANTPFMLISTSGTTGRPMGTVHDQPGFPLEAAHDFAFCLAIQPLDRAFWLPDIGWMRSPLLIRGTLLLSATIVSCDGTPDWTVPDRLWRLVATHRITVLGLTPTVVRALMARGAAPTARHDLSSLRAFGSTGEPWSPSPWWWLLETVGNRQRTIIDDTGGTEIGGGILARTTIEPKAPCSFTRPIPGMAADVVNENGRPVRGREGELVARQPMVGMTRGFWRDPERYLATYWSCWPDLWIRRDRALIDDGYWFILGRSDDTLKFAGKRLGPAEVESIAVSHPAIQEAAAIGILDPVKGEALVPFWVTRSGIEPPERLAEEISDLIAQQLGKPSRFQRVYIARELFRTRNTKIMRRENRAAYLGQDTEDLFALEKSAAVDEIAALGRAAGAQEKTERKQP